MFRIPKLRRNSQKGFTLVELLVVIAIIGVLATLVLLQLNTARARARDTKRITDVNQIRTGLEQYWEDNGGQYPTAIDAATLGRYLTRVPTDPLTGQAYHFGYHQNGTVVDGYVIWAQLEQTAAALNGDADVDTTGGGWTGDRPSSTDDSTCAQDTTKCIYDQGVNP